MPAIGKGSPDALQINAALSAWQQGDVALKEPWFLHAAMPTRPLTIEADTGQNEEVAAITSEVVGGATHLRLVGEIDLSSAHLMVDSIDEAVEAGATTAVFDFGGVTFVNSTGLGAMVAATKRLRADGGDLVLRQFRGIPASALATTGLDRFFTIES